MHGLMTVLYSRDRQLGVNYIGKLCRPLAQAAGIENFGALSGLSIRRFVLTKLANDDNLCQKEVQEHARHHSAYAQNHYIMSSDVSQLQRQMVMGRGFNFMREDESEVFLPAFNDDDHHPPAPRKPRKVINPYLKSKSNPYARNG